MRPLRLVMQAFGPYAEREEVDFAALQASGLFLVHGPTGAGKTSVLDALCFALYGTASGSGRDGRQLRSHHAPPHLPTEVRLDFALGAVRYRVVRRPEQPRPKRRGEGFTTERATAALWRLPATEEEEGAAAGDDASEGELLVTGVREVGEEIAALLGFSAEQFRQVVVLPQGEFRRFIEAGVGERQEILRRLFDTEACQAFEAALRQRAADLAGRLDDLNRQVDDILGRHRAASEAGLAERTAALARRLKAARAFDRRLETLLATLRRLQEVAAALERTAAQHRRAEAEHRQAGEARMTAHEALQAAEEALARLEAEAPQRQALARRLEELTALRHRAERLAALEDERHTHDAKRQEAETALAALDEDRERLQKALAEARAARESLLKTEADIARLQPRLKDLQAAETRLVTLRKRLQALQAAREGERSARAEVERAEARLAAAEAALQALQARWRKAQAAHLARHLLPGEPCPVCGAREHPAPTRETVGDAAPPTEEEERRLTEARETAAQALQTARERAARATADLARAEEAAAQALQDLITRLEGADLPLSSWPVPDRIEAASEETLVALAEALCAQRTALQKDLDTLHQARKQATARAGRLEALERQLAERERRVQSLQEKRNALAAALARLEGQLAQLRADLPEGLPDMAALQREIEALERRLHEQEEALKTARDTRDRQAAALAEAEGRLKAAAEALKAAEESRLEAVQALKTALETAEAITLPADDPLLDEEGEANGEERSERDWAAACRTWRDALAAARAVTDGATPAVAPLTALLQTAHERLDGLRGALQARLGELTAQRRNLEEDLKRIERARSERARLQERAGLLHHLAELAAGRGEPKVSFERFVLARLFEEVLEAASLRLLRMSRGRYRLLRAAGEAEAARRDRRRLAGLEMVVHDAHTGTTRPVQTLSGGESFLAALALALGLADVARRHAGGRPLETLFVDEGFGSLDPEALDHAMAALADLRQDGRLIGIISHVAELKERIPVRLAVRPGPAGSHLHLET